MNQCLIFKCISMTKKSKTLLIIASVCSILGIGTMIYSKSFFSCPTDSDVEALSWCEITKEDKTILSCDGENTCTTRYRGLELTCDGTKH